MKNLLILLGIYQFLDKKQFTLHFDKSKLTKIKEFLRFTSKIEFGYKFNKKTDHERCYEFVQNLKRIGYLKESVNDNYIIFEIKAKKLRIKKTKE